MTIVKGKKAHSLYETWRGMVRRCHDPKATGFELYGGRGISVCQAWRDDFWQFVEDVGARPSKEHTLDRVDNEGDYEKDNVQWATKSQQNSNTRFNRLLTANGKSQTLEAWAKETQLPKSTLFNRLKRGWADERTVNTPAQSKASSGTILNTRQRQTISRLGLNVYTVASRIRRGWTFMEAIKKPIGKQKGGRKAHA